MTAAEKLLLLRGCDRRLQEVSAAINTLARDPRGNEAALSTIGIRLARMAVTTLSPEREQVENEHQSVV